MYFIVRFHNHISQNDCNFAFLFSPVGKHKKQLATERPSSHSRHEDDELPGNNILDVSDNESVVEDNPGDGTYETEDETDATTGTEEEEDYEKPDWYLLFI